MKYPVTEAELKKAGYELLKKALCRGNRCGTQIHWYKTPQGKHMPLSKVEGEPGFLLQPHWIDCVNAQDFRKEKRA